MRALGLAFLLAIAGCSSPQSAEPEGNPRLDAVVVDVDGSGDAAPAEDDSQTATVDASEPDGSGEGAGPEDGADYNSGGRQFLMALVEGSVPLDTVMSTDHGVVVWQNEHLTVEIPMVGIYCDAELASRATELLEMLQTSVTEAVNAGLEISCSVDRCTIPSVNQWSPTTIVVLHTPSEVLRIDALYFIEGSMVTEVYLDQQLSDAEELRRSLRDGGGCDALSDP